MEMKKVSMPLLMRLPGYLDYLYSLPDRPGATVSATTIANALGLGDVMVRKDLAMVSGGGRRKVGHLRSQLILDIEEFLDRNNVANAILVGAGRLGQALLCYDGYEMHGLNLLAGFDKAPVSDRTETGKPIYPMDQLRAFCYRNKVRIGIITVPAAYAQEVCDQLIDCGIDAIWNFAPVNLTVPENTLVQSINLAASLAALRMQQIKQNKNQDSQAAAM